MVRNSMLGKVSKEKCLCLLGNEWRKKLESMIEL